MKRIIFPLVLALTCGCLEVIEHGRPLTLQLVTCEGGALPPIESWRVKVMTPGSAPTQEDFSTFPQTIVVAPAADVVVTVEALQGGVLVARGGTRHVTVSSVPTTTDPALTLAVQLFPVGFSRQCGALLTGRSAHTATQLLDGTVLFGGGLDSSGTALSSLEVAEPATNSMAGSLAITAQGTRIELPRAFHTATRTSIGQVVFAWGETRSPANDTVPLSTILFVDPPTGFSIGALGPRNPALKARTRHSAFVRGQKLLFAGGLTREAGLQPLDVVDRLNLDTLAFDDSVSPGAASNEAAIVATESTLVIAGGTAGGQLSATVRLLPVAGGLPRGATLRSPRAGAGAVALGERVLLLGGVGAGAQFVGSSEWIDVGAGTTSDGPAIAPRSRPCAVAVDDHRALVLGGTTGLAPSAAAELVDASGTVTTLSFPGPGRVDHTCTLLEDGTVLIAGGQGSGGALNDLWRFVPPP